MSILPNYQQIFDRSGNDPIQTLPNKILLNNRYEIGKILGTGGFATTYLAWDQQYKHPVVIKELFPSEIVQRDRTTNITLKLNSYQDSTTLVSVWEQITAKFIQESEILFRLPPSTHRVRSLEYFTQFGTYYYAMTYQPGETLSDWLKAQTPNLDHARYIWDLLRPLWQDMNIVHATKILHRDIKPDNILLVDRGEKQKSCLVLIDFGIARTNFDSGTGTKTSFQAFSEYFAAPEQKGDLNEPQGPWTDVYAAAATTLYAITKQKITDQLNAVLYAQQAYEKLGITQNDAWALASGLHYATKDRPPSMEAWLAKIQVAFDEQKKPEYLRLHEENQRLKEEIEKIKQNSFPQIAISKKLTSEKLIQDTRIISPEISINPVNNVDIQPNAQENAQENAHLKLGILILGSVTILLLGLIAWKLIAA